jgi:DNA excision repair protein ERCC-3
VCNGEARSGVVVLPCGAGKTLTGIACAVAMQQRTMVVCSSSVALSQWADALARFTEGAAPPYKFVRGASIGDPRSPLVLTTYSMLTFDRSTQANAWYASELTKRTWGLLLLDEVHCVPADTFQAAVGKLDARCRVGLTATLLREDDQLRSLNFSVGPKLYEADWMTLTQGGYLASVDLMEVWCSMPPSFATAHAAATSERTRRGLYSFNPTKLVVCEALLRAHRERGERVLIYATDLRVLRYYSEQLGAPTVLGDTPHDERERRFRSFRDGTLDALLVSSVGDVAVDLPEASVVLQVSAHFGSRRQEAQRLGRVLRPNAKRAAFYTLISHRTEEQTFARKRQSFVSDQGYTYHVSFAHPLLTRIAQAHPTIRPCSIEDEAARDVVAFQRVLDALPSTDATVAWTPTALGMFLRGQYEHACALLVVQRRARRKRKRSSKLQKLARKYNFTLG